MHSAAECQKALCFFCIMNHPDPLVRRSQASHFFQQMPLTGDKDHVLVLSSLRNIAIAQPDDPEFPSLGIFTSMTRLIQKGIHHKQWLLKDQNIYIPYYAAHIIGTYATSNPQSAAKAAESGAIPALLELLRGKISWVEQRAAAGALCHLASHDVVFRATMSETEDIVELAMEIASSCLGTVYRQFLATEERNRLKYHCELLTRGLGGVETENKKAEEWGVQLQEWCLYLLTCFAGKGSGRFLDRICELEFLTELCGMRGGIESCKDSPGGLGLIRELCNSEIGRDRISNRREVLENLCDVARSSDYWHETAIECLVLLLKDPGTRNRVIGFSAAAMAQLVELRRTGETITRALLQDYHRIKYGEMRLGSAEAEKALEETWELKVERKKKEKVMNTEELKQRELMAGLLKREGNESFWRGEVEKAVSEYSKALEVCPLKLRRERIVLYSNRAQCCLVMKEAELAIGDATRAMCLSGGSRPHRKSLWRRAQAFDMKGLGRESLMDGLRFVEVRRRKDVEIPCFAARLVQKQMHATWPFAAAVKSEVAAGKCKKVECLDHSRRSEE
ncbi:unnamed protein product [Linum trigynum]|uniref:Protein unc-45 homolog B n=1 Tax=Linum trigynum TaxID=586398 RepID=A0AAV2DG21_9ROSI